MGITLLSCAKLTAVLAATARRRSGKARERSIPDDFSSVGRQLRASEDALRRSEERIREVVESVLHGLVVVDGEGRIELVNRQLEAMFGQERSELIGASIEILMPERYRARHGGLIASFFANPSRRDMAGRMELYACARDGREFPVEIGLNPIRAGANLRVLATITDVTARKAAHAQLESALAEKTALLNEIHHRVKNNLQVVTSLLKMQARTVAPEVGRVLAESRSRIQTMAIIHQLLYEHGNLSRIHLGSYLAQLVSLLRDTYADQRRTVETVLEGATEDCHIDAQRAISCGLIVNEIITNSFKHAFPDGRKGVVTVALSRPTPERIEIRVADNGVGIPDSVELGGGRSLGLRLLPTLTEQLGGELRLLRENGSSYELRFSP